MSSVAAIPFLSTILQYLFIFFVPQGQTCTIDSLYQFGASISDTGNLIRLGPVGASSTAARLPYGESSAAGPTGRFSDGLLMIDFIAKRLNLPLLNPYLERNAPFDHGVNFAVAGSTALDAAFLAAKGVETPVTNRPLSVQLDWFNTFLNSTCPDCKKKLGRALVFVGEIGRNDFNYAVEQHKSIHLVRSYVPDIVQAIANTVKEVIGMGALRVVVPGSFATGCFPFALYWFPSSNPGDYDDLGCVRSVNEFAVYQNNHLQAALDSLRLEFPHATILYADYYSAFLTLMRRAPSLGFEEQSLLRICCGPCNIYPKEYCGSDGAHVCSNPNQYLHWDGMHLTQAAYHHLSEMILTDILSAMQCVL